MNEITGVLYAIFRVGKKYKNIGMIKGFQYHMEREYNVENANPKKKLDNKLLIGDHDIYKTMQDHTKDCWIRKNGNVATEILLTASPEYFKHSTLKEKEIWVNENVKFLQTYFGDSCIYAVLHEDESTPHIHSLISHKVRTRNGKLTISNSRLFDGVEKLRAWQDVYAKEMGKFNLSRGIRFSKAKHTKIRHYYQLINEPMNNTYLQNVIDETYHLRKVKEEFVNYINGIIDNNRHEVIEELYKLCSIVTAPGKFYNAHLEHEQRNKVYSMLNDEQIYKLSQITRHGKVNNREQYYEIMERTQIKREVQKMKKIIENADKDKKRYKEELREIREDKEMYRTIIKTLSQYYHIPQQAIENIIKDQKEKEV